MSEKIVSIPAAKRTINALKDMGYDLNSAVADIVDNSISRGKAKNIFVEFKVNEKNKLFISIIDDGCGMDSKKLEEAMRIGSNDDDYTSGDLSKYGMGMKTASMSQAMKLTVFSKTKTSNKTSFSWDLHHVNKNDKWEILKLNQNEISLYLENLSIYLSKKSNSLINQESWTLVLWEDLEGLQKNYESYSSKITSTNWRNKTTDFLETYLRLVFNRFLSGENGARKTNIFLNDQKLKPLDPFCKSEKNTRQVDLSDKNGNFIINDIYPPIVIKRYVLPTNPLKPGEFTFSSVDAWEDAKGTLSWNESQGYYVYRNNRLIAWGGWYRTKALDEHDKLARASIDLTDMHDDLFTVDVKKTKIQFPEELKNHLKDNVNAKFISEAKKRYSGSEHSQNEIKNPVREKSKKVNQLAAQLIQNDNITVRKGANNSLIINNKFGNTVTEDVTYKNLEIGQKIISMPFGNKDLFWKMVPNPDNEFQVIVNSEHPFYDKVYGESEKDKKITAIMDAFLFTMSFVELKCITNNNEMLFDQMKEVASSVLTKFVDENII
jgi:hypothetical protein